MNSMVMQKDIISNWEPRHNSLFGVELIKLNHRLIRDRALHPRGSRQSDRTLLSAEHLGIRARGTEIDDPKTMEGELGNATGMEAIQAIENGRMWMNIRRVMDWAPEYKKLLDQIFEEFRSAHAGLQHVQAQSPAS